VVWQLISSFLQLFVVEQSSLSFLPIGCLHCALCV